MFTVLIPAYTRGGRRRRNPEYVTVQNAIARARKQRDHAAVRQLRRLQRQLPSGDPQDPDYRRLRYSRYADDVLFGLIGPRAEAEEIKQRLTEFLRDDLRLDLNQAKTLITHARTGAAKFLGYEITVQHGDQTLRRGRRAVNGVVRLRAPTTVIKAKSAPYLQHRKPERRTKLLTFDDHTIVSTYGAEYRGIVQYYLLAGDVYRLGRLHWVMQTSLLKTLAAKHRCAVTRTARKHRSKIQTPHGPRTCIQVSVSRGDGRRPLVARFGGIPLIRQHTAVLTDRAPAPQVVRRKELITRLLAGTCELCRRHQAIQVHHVRRLADLTTGPQPRPEWMTTMAKRRRKTLVVCDTCHTGIHHPTAK